MTGQNRGEIWRIEKNATTNFCSRNWLKKIFYQCFGDKFLWKIWTSKLFKMTKKLIKSFLRTWWRFWHFQPQKSAKFKRVCPGGLSSQKKKNSFQKPPKTLLYNRLESNPFVRITSEKKKNFRYYLKADTRVYSRAFK